MIEGYIYTLVLCYCVNGMDNARYGNSCTLQAKFPILLKRGWGDRKGKPNSTRDSVHGNYYQKQNKVFCFTCNLRLQNWVLK